MTPPIPRRRRQAIPTRNRSPTVPERNVPRPGSPEKQLARFIAKFTPQIASQVHAVLAKMRKHLPGAVELVYDNYNALAIGFGPTERTSDFIFSIAVFPRWVSLFFAHGVGLPDPENLLRGKGNQVRHIVLKSPETLDEPAIRDLLASALERAKQQPDRTERNRIVIKSVSLKQRPRRP